MAYLRDYKHDVFISYAHVDNEPLSGAEKGWVTTLLGNLETFLRRKLGEGANDTSIWMDYELTGNRPFAGSIEEALRSSATLLVVVSPGYLASPWCGRERDTFANAIRDQLEAGSRVFRVESDEIELNQLPESMKEALGYRFWARERDQRTARTLGLPVPIPTEREGKLYFDRVLDLAQDLANELKRLRARAADGSKLSASAGEQRPPTEPTAPTLLLAEATDDLDPEREEVRRYAVQAGLRVLPERFYPRDDVAAFSTKFQEDLAQSNLVVQLLSNVSGRKPEGAPAGFPGLQDSLAAAAGKPHLKWRRSGLDLNGVKEREPAYGEVLAGADVRECGLEEFKRAVVDTVRKSAPQPKPKGTNEFQVLISADLADGDDAKALCKLLDEAGENWIRPQDKGDPARLRQSLEQALSACDALVMLYGKTDPEWVAAQIVQARRTFSTRESPPSGMALIELPPDIKDAIETVSMRGVRTLDWKSAGLCSGNVQTLLAELHGQ